MKKSFVIEYFDAVLFMKQKPRRNKKKERDKNKEPKESQKYWSPKSAEWICGGFFELKCFSDFS